METNTCWTFSRPVDPYLRFLPDIKTSEIAVDQVEESNQRRPKKMVRPVENDSRELYPEERDYEAGVVTKRTWKGAIWDTLDLPPQERKLLFKVDTILITLASVCCIYQGGSSAEDSSGISSRIWIRPISTLPWVHPHVLLSAQSDRQFLSGMKEDLGMYGNQLVTAVSIWTVGYVVGQIPSNLLLTRVDPRWVIPSVSLRLCFLHYFEIYSQTPSPWVSADNQLELGWGIATLGSYGVKSYKALYALRFLVGLFE